MNMKHFRHLLCTTFACALSAQQTWKVVCDGSYGAHFTDLPAAVNAAAPGDTILACVPALYCPTQLTAPTINKALRIVGLHLGAVPGNPDPSIAPILGTLAINGIHAGSTLTLSNFVQGTYVPNAPGLSITNCAGKVVIENYVLNTLGIPGYVLSIANCNDVVVRGCSIGLAGSPMTITNSNVLFTTTAISYPGPFPFGGGYTQTTEAIRATNSTLTFVGCDVRGVDQQQQPLLAGREAFVITNSNVILAAANYVAGGRFPGGPPYS